MGSVDTTVLLQSSAVVAAGTAGASLLRTKVASSAELLVGVGLLVAAALMAVDGMVCQGHGLPLAGWALLAFAFVGLGAADTAAVAAARPGRLAGLGVVVGSLLHWAHAATPVQPGFEFGARWYGLDLTCAVGLGWLVHARRDAPAAVRCLLAALACGLAATSFVGDAAPGIVAGMLAAGCVPMLWRCANERPQSTAIAAATAFATALACTMRASSLASGAPLVIAGLGDPLLVLAALFAAFGTALGLAPGLERSEADRPRTDAPLTTGNAAPGIVSASGPHPVVTSTDELGVSAVVRSLREPVTSLLGAADLLAAENDAPALATLRHHGRRLKQLLADVDGFEQLGRGKVALADEAYDLPRLLQECVEQCRPQLAEVHAELRTEIAASTPRWVQGDGERTRQLVVRLLELATKDAAVGPVDFLAGADDHCVHLAVLNRTTTARPLASFEQMFCRRLARALGGDLELRPRDAGGIEFHATLPKVLAPEWEIDLLAEDEQRAPPAAPAEATQLRGKVLVVDDSRDHQRLVASMLERVGAEVTTADSGDVALHLLTKMQFDLVLLDMQMPDKDGYTTVTQMRSDQVTTPVLALTADAAPADVERCLAAGCNGHLAKPVDLAALHHALAMHLPTAS